MNDIEKKLKEFEDKLNESFVDKYDSVKEWMLNVNIILNNLKVNYRYDSYDQFCMDYKKECLDYARKKEDIDFIDSRMVLLWIPFVLSNLIVNKAEEHGRNVIPLNKEEKTIKKELSSLIDNLITNKTKEEIERYKNNIESIMRNDFNIDNLSEDDISLV